VVAVEARQAGGRTDPDPLPLPMKPLVRGDQPRLVVIPADPRPLPTVHQYDALLTR
jgi:hypothetical protein